jgi:hypothetical protein
MKPNGRMKPNGWKKNIRSEQYLDTRCPKEFADRAFQNSILQPDQRGQASIACLPLGARGTLWPPPLYEPGLQATVCRATPCQPHRAETASIARHKSRWKAKPGHSRPGLAANFPHVTDVGDLGMRCHAKISSRLHGRAPPSRWSERLQVRPRTAPTTAKASIDE